MNKLDKQYQSLLQDILDNGIKKEDRTGTGTFSVFGRQIRHKMSEGFPLLTTKKIPFKLIVTELLWFLRGDTNIKFLVDNNCHIWDGDAYKNYISKTEKEANDLSEYGDRVNYRPYSQEQFINRIKTDDEFAKTWGDLGPIYGKQWVNWETYWHEYGPKDGGNYLQDKPINQIQNLIEQLKTNPDSRRLMVSAWNVSELNQMVLPPCHYGFQVYTRELSLDERRKLAKYDSEFVSPMTVESWDRNNIPTRAISLMWNQRSVDTFLGLPFNIASYGLLLEIIAKEVNMVPDELIGNLGDTHLYLNHVEQAKEQIGRKLTLEERYQLALPIWKEKYGPLADMMVMTNVDNTPYKIPTRTREPYPLPKLGEIPDYSHMKDNWECYEPSDFVIENYQSHPHIKAPLSN